MDQEFGRYGKIREIAMKRDFCFVSYFDPKEAQEAVRDMNGRKLCGAALRVEFTKS